MHRQASELKIHEEIEEDDDDLDEISSHKIKKASPEINKKRPLPVEYHSPELDLQKVEEAQAVERPSGQKSSRRSHDTVSKRSLADKRRLPGVDAEAEESFEIPNFRESIE
jgi:hypothetical protein